VWRGQRQEGTDGGSSGGRKKREGRMMDVLDSCALCGVTSKLLALHGGLGLASIRAARAKLVGCWAPLGSFGLLLVAKCVTRARFLLLYCFCCYSCCCSYCWPRSDSFQACRIPASPAHHSVCHFACVSHSKASSRQNVPGTANTAPGFTNIAHRIRPHQKSRRQCRNSLNYLRRRRHG
jgi:hypothetical protein